MVHVPLQRVNGSAMPRPTSSTTRLMWVDTTGISVLLKRKLKLCAQWEVENINRLAYAMLDKRLRCAVTRVVFVPVKFEFFLTVP
jgi:hypothetical protein